MIRARYFANDAFILTKQDAIFNELGKIKKKREPRAHADSARQNAIRVAMKVSISPRHATTPRRSQRNWLLVVCSRASRAFFPSSLYVILFQPLPPPPSFSQNQDAERSVSYRKRASLSHKAYSSKQVCRTYRLIHIVPPVRFLNAVETSPQKARLPTKFSRRFPRNTFLQTGIIV